MDTRALAELRAAFEQPFSILGRDAAEDRNVVVISWPSVPVELVRAAGFSPIYARGCDLPTPAADRVLEPGLFPNRLRQLVEAALTGRLSGIAAVLLPRSSDPDYKCFLYLRELVRRGIASALPPVLLFDLLHSDTPEAHAYNTDRTRDLFGRLAGLCRRRLRVDDVGAAIVSFNRARAAARRIDELRRGTPRISGMDALPLLAAFWQFEPQRYTTLAGDAADFIESGSPLEGARVVLTGEPVDAPGLHAAIEAAYAVVVGEVSPFGSLGTSTDVAEREDPFVSLADHYAREAIDARLPAETLLRKLDGLLGHVDAVVVSLPPDDASFGWDYPRTRDLLARRSIPHTVLTGDPASGDNALESERIRSLLDGVRAQREARYG